MLRRVAVALALTLVLSSCTLTEVNWWRNESGLPAIKAGTPEAKEAVKVGTTWWNGLSRSDIQDIRNWFNPPPPPKRTSATDRVPGILWRIAGCESGNGGRGVNYSARNPRSSAAGGWQFLSGTWRYVARTYAGTWNALGFGHLRGEATSVSSMAHARPEVQAAAAIVLHNREGTRPWLASKRCWS